MTPLCCVFSKIIFWRFQKLRKKVKKISIFNVGRPVIQQKNAPKRTDFLQKTSHRYLYYDNSYKKYDKNSIFNSIKK
jgi:hypothetical protein